MNFLRWILLGLLAAVAAVFAWPYVVDSEVVVRTGNWVIEIKLVVLIGALLLLMLLVSWIYRIWRLRKTVPQQLAQRKSRLWLEQSILALADQRWDDAEHALNKAAKANPDHSATQYLAAARAAQAQGRHHQREAYLALANDAGSDPVSSQLLRAEVLMQDGEYQAALNLLSRSRSIPALNAKIACAKAIQDYPLALDYLSQLKSAGGVSKDIVQEKRTEMILSALTHAQNNAAIDAITAKLRRHEKQDVGITTALVLALRRLNEDDLALKILTQRLQKRVDPEYLKLWSAIPGGDPSKRLKQLQKWAASCTDSARAELALARMCMQQELWGNARVHFEKSFAIRKDPLALEEYAKLMEKMGDPGTALKYYREAAEASTLVPYNDPRTQQRT